MTDSFGDLLTILSETNKQYANSEWFNQVIYQLSATFSQGIIYHIWLSDNSFQVRVSEMQELSPLVTSMDIAQMPPNSYETKPDIICSTQWHTGGDW